jgi:hypothetical protein
MAMTPWASLVRLVADGDPVNAAATRKPSDDLAQRTQYLKEILDALRAQQLIAVPDVALDTLTVVGTPVYLDTATNTYRPALASATDVSATMSALPTAYAVGLVVEKTAPGRGTVGTFGRFSDLAPLSAWNTLMETGTGGAVAGNYYLSSSQAGKLSRNPGSLGVYVGQLDTAGVFAIRSTPPDYGAHTHHRFALTPLPAVLDPTNVAQVHKDGGTGKWIIDVPDASRRGWLPAAGQSSTTWPTGWTGTDASNAFWYNLNHADDASLRALFPPVPVDSHVFIQGGLVQPDSRVIVNEFGIWWTENINGAQTSAPWSDSMQAAPTAEPEIDFWFSRILMATDGGLVRSLIFAANSGLVGRFVRAGGLEATDGDLQLIIDALVEDPTTDEGAFAVKQVTGKTFTRGAIVGRLKVAGGLSAQATAGNSADGYHGVVTLTLTDSALSQGVAAVADLNNARVDSLDGLQAVSLLPGRTATPVFTIDVSPSALPTSKMYLTLWIYSSGSGVLPTTNAIQIDYKIVPPTMNPAAPVALPGTWTSLAQVTAATTGITALVAGRYSKTNSAAVGYPFVLPVVPAGSVVLVRVTRSGLTDGFPGTISLPRLEFKLAAS